jgi:RIO-like serine/threonine protein kinase
MSKSSKSQNVLHDFKGNKYTIREDNLHTVASNQIYRAVENPNIYIKVLKHDYFPDLEEESAYIRQKIENELGMAKMLSERHFPVPHVYHTSVDIGAEFITGYIVMDKIEGRIVSSLGEFDMYFNKIFEALNDLLESGVVYNDMNINNFIISAEDDEVYVIDFEDAMRVENAVELGSKIVNRLSNGKLSLNREYVKSHLRESVKTRMEYRMDEPASTPRASRKKSPSRKASSRSPSSRVSRKKSSPKK